jgi:hypothetical protein
MQHQPVNLPFSSNTRTASSEWVLEIKSLDQVNLVRPPEKAKTTLLRQWFPVAKSPRLYRQGSGQKFRLFEHPSPKRAQSKAFLTGIAIVSIRATDTPIPRKNQPTNPQFLPPHVGFLEAIL